MQRTRLGYSLMGMAVAAFVTLTVLVLGAPLAASAAERSAYTVHDININKTGQTGLLAREAGLVEARSAAFAHLFERLVPRAYHHARPDLLPEQMNAMIASVDVLEEQITATSYRARLAINFAPRAMQDLLASRRIPFSDAVSPPLLILPVYEWAGALQLWEVPNPWHSAWAERVGAQGLVATVMAKGTPREQLILSADQALQGDRAGLQQLAAAYNAGGAIVALGRFRVDPRSGRPELNVTLTGYGAAPPGPITERFEGSGGGRAGLAAEQLTRNAAAAMADRLADAWKAENLRRTDLASNALVVSVPLTYIGDYATALRRLDAVEALDSVVTTRLSKESADFRLAYRSDLEQMRQALERYGMQLVQQPGGWLLRING